ncbi:AAA family ATPase [Streptacidiphilus sp. MAP12-16]|uniref:AAA family ATPase n=1 Tax=Streptacidiphilus sp. MAP12-16 TaxID=3156300 RepID=UPI0035119E05
MVGSETSRLVVLRGNSGSGKSSIAAEIRARFGRGVAVVSQDLLRRGVLQEHDVSNGANIGLIDLVARYALDQGFHVVVEGILGATRYEAMLTALLRDHRGVSRCYYLDVPFEETLARHATKPNSREFGADEMRLWYRRLDLLTTGAEQVIPATSSLQASVEQILSDTHLMLHPVALRSNHSTAQRSEMGRNS